VKFFISTSWRRLWLLDDVQILYGDVREMGVICSAALPETSDVPYRS